MQKLLAVAFAACLVACSNAYAPDSTDTLAQEVSSADSGHPYPSDAGFDAGSIVWDAGLLDDAGMTPPTKPGISFPNPYPTLPPAIDPMCSPAFCAANCKPASREAGTYCEGLIPTKCICICPGFPTAPPHTDFRDWLMACVLTHEHVHYTDDWCSPLGLHSPKGAACDEAKAYGQHADCLAAMYQACFAKPPNFTTIDKVACAASMEAEWHNAHDNAVACATCCANSSAPGCPGICP